MEKDQGRWRQGFLLNEHTSNPVRNFPAPFRAQYGKVREEAMFQNEDKRLEHKNEGFGP